LEVFFGKWWNLRRSQPFFFEVFPKPVMIEMAFGAFWVTYFLLHGFVRK
jgi:hypothetical protein